MARTLEPVAAAGRVVFELDRFELANEDQYQLLGRWFGVRGRRFIRPTLTVTVHDQSIRLLADLDDKPWAPEEGVPWRAAFPSRFEADEVQRAELTVAPDITIELRVSGSGSGQKAKAPSKPAKPEPRAPAEPVSDSVSTALGHELAAAQRRQDQLTRQLDRAEADRAHTAARLDELLGNLSEALQDRDQAQAARDEALGRLDELDRRHGDIAVGRDAALGERDAAVRARDAALEERDVARLERDAARQERDLALADRSAAIGAQTRAESERDTAVVSLAHAEEERQLAQTLLDQAQIQRDEALAAHQDAIRERESIRGTVNQLNSEMAQQASSRGAAMVMRRATQEPAAFRTHTPLLPRAMAVIFMMAVIVVLLIVLHVA